jgi:hypothetical protein
MTKLLCSFTFLTASILLAGEGAKTRSGIRLDTHMVYDDYLYPSEISPAQAWPEITYLNVTRREGTNLFDIHYRVEDADSATVEVIAMVMDETAEELADRRFANKFLLPMASFVEGTQDQIGTGVATGTDLKHLVWDAGADMGASRKGIFIHLMVSDGRPPLSLHFVTLPAQNDLPELQVSKYTGFGNPGMLDNVWLWLLAKGTVKLAGSQVLGTTAPFADAVLAEHYGEPTSTGQNFLLALIGNVRLATTAEMLRIQEASTPGTVTQWEPVHQVAGRPLKINEYNIETGGETPLYIVREP